MIDRRSASLAIAGAAASAGCTTALPPHRPNEVAHVPWSRHASVYEVNVRQFTPEGTLSAFELHPERYKRNERGEVYSVTFGSGPTVEYWTDVVGLDYAERGLWPAMTEEMAWWLRETGIDGFRCDVAGLVPTPFWEQARAELDRIKPVFMLAESDKPELHARAFDMTYDWDLHDQLRAIAQGRADARALRAWWHRRNARYPADAYRMTFTGNHDSNSWHGSDRELYGSIEAF